MDSIEQKNNTGISITGVLYVLFLFFSFWLLMDPLYLGYDNVRVARDLGVFKYIGVFFGLSFVFFAYVGVQLYGEKNQKQGMKTTLKQNGLIFVFALVIIAGSLYSRFFLDITESFLQMGVAIIGFLVGVLAFWLSKNPKKMIDKIMKLFLIFSLFAFTWIVYARLQGGQAFHTEIFLIIPVFMYFFLVSQRFWFQTLLLILMIAIGIISFKFTAFIVLAMTLVYLSSLYMHKILVFHNVLRYLIYCFLFLGGVLVLSFLVYLFINNEEMLPTGSVSVRFQTYEYAFNNFLESPVWGNLFTESTLVPLYELTVLNNNHVITHSDFLDILSHGGLILFGCFIISIVIILLNVRKIIKAVKLEKIEIIQLHSLSLFISSGLVVAIFNAPLLMLPIGIWFWFLLGVLSAYTVWLTIPKKEASI